MLKDLDGNDIKSSDFFKRNNVTVVNYWFSTCKPCVGELPELEALNKKLAEKGGQVVGINTFTIDGDKTAISEASIMKLCIYFFIQVCVFQNLPD